MAFANIARRTILRSVRKLIKPDQLKYHQFTRLDKSLWIKEIKLTGRHIKEPWFDELSSDLTRRLLVKLSINTASTNSPASCYSGHLLWEDGWSVWFEEGWRSLMLFLIKFPRISAWLWYSTTKERHQEKLRFWASNTQISSVNTNL